MKGQRKERVQKAVLSNQTTPTPAATVLLVCETVARGNCGALRAHLKRQSRSDMKASHNPVSSSIFPRFVQHSVFLCKYDDWVERHVSWHEFHACALFLKNG